MPETAVVVTHVMIRTGTRAIAFVALLTTLVASCDRNSILEKITYEQFKTCIFSRINEPSNPLDMVIIDVREPDEYKQGYILLSVNIPLSTLIDESGAIINGGAALTNVVTAKNIALITYGETESDGLAFAEAAKDLDYDEVYYYGGIEDWESHNGFYAIDYEAFKEWHEEFIPFEDGENCLIDINPTPWYEGTHEDYPEGHIPCAVNIPIADWTDAYFNLVEDAVAFTNVVTNIDSKIVIYCGDPYCSKGPIGAQVIADLGYSDVYLYKGSWWEWVRELGEETTPGAIPCPEDEMLYSTKTANYRF